MGWLERLMGTEDENDRRTYRDSGATRGATTNPVSSEDERALARYQYMLRTAPPESIEQAHEEAFARLTPEQRQQALLKLSAFAPEAERATMSADPRQLARAATRAEMRQPGAVQQALGDSGGRGGMGGGMGMGMGMLGGGLLTGLAGGFIGSAIAQSFFNNPAVAQDYQQSEEAQGTGDIGGYEEGNPDGSDASNDPYGDPGADQGTDAGAGDDWGSGDYGGGDFGGGDFGGGDF